MPQRQGSGSVSREAVKARNLMPMMDCNFIGANANSNWNSQIDHQRLSVLIASLMPGFISRNRNPQKPIWIQTCVVSAILVSNALGASLNKCKPKQIQSTSVNSNLRRVSNSCVKGSGGLYPKKRNSKNPIWLQTCVVSATLVSKALGAWSKNCNSKNLIWIQTCILSSTLVSKALEASSKTRNSKK